MPFDGRDESKVLDPVVVRHCRWVMKGISLKGMATVSRSRAGDQYRIPADPVITTLMTSWVVTVGPDMALIDALRVMDSAAVRHLPVLDGGRCVGLLTEIDMLRRLVADGLGRLESTARLTAGDVCRRPPPVVPVWATRATAAQAMLDSGCEVVLVLRDDHVHGIVTASDLVTSLVETASGSCASVAEPRRPVAEDVPGSGT